MSITETQAPDMRSYHSDDHDSNESALRAMLHIVAGVALDLQRGRSLTEAQRADLHQVAQDDAMWPETARVVRRLANQRNEQEEKACLGCGSTDCKFEKHHYPIPKLSGGEATIPLCKTCHNLVSRVHLKNWPMYVYERAIASELSGPALLAFLKVVEKYYSKPENHDDD